MIGVTLCGAMRTFRRAFSLGIVFVVLLALLASARPDTPSAKTYRVYAGTYTTKTTSKGIYQFRFDPATGKMSAPELAAETGDPSWVIIDPGGKYLYAANEAGKASTISAFAIDAKNGKLTLLNQLPALGEDPCHLSFDRTGKYLFTANYSSGNVAVFPILSDGKLGEHTANVKDEGTLGPNKERQEGPHAHWVEPALDNHFLFVADLGLDAILIYRFDSTKGTLIPNKPIFIRPLDAGAGPRHAAFLPDGSHFYVLSEINSTVTSFAYAPSIGVFGYLGFVHILPANFQGRNQAAEIEIHPSSKFLYASNRGHDSIAAYGIEAKAGKLTLLQDVPTGGKEPRHFAIDPSGQFLLAENQFSDSVVEFRIDLSTGKLTPTGETLSVPSPVCIAFLQIE